MQVHLNVGLQQHSLDFLLRSSCSLVDMSGDRNRSHLLVCLLQGTYKQSSPVSNSSVYAAECQHPYVGEYAAAEVHEVFVQPPLGTTLKTAIQREGPGSDCAKLLVVTGSMEGAICDELVQTG
jgi:hypothetical protein